MPTNSNKLVCWSLLDQCVTPVGVGWRWLELVFTRLNMLIDIELVGVCWCSVNMTVIFHKILNPTANLSQLVCWSLLAFVCAVWTGLKKTVQRNGPNGAWSVTWHWSTGDSHLSSHSGFSEDISDSSRSTGNTKKSNQHEDENGQITETNGYNYTKLLH